MKTTLIQAPLIWEDSEANRKYFENRINNLPEDLDLVVLPEMFTSGFTMKPQAVAETMEGATVNWMKDLAKAKDCAITGSLVIEEIGNYYNRLLFVFPSGEIQYYDKRHLFTLAGENKVYAGGKDKLVVDYRGFRICLLICYDLRFPVFARNVEDYDLLIFVANWPKVRISAWDILIRARAIENMSYVIGVNRVGLDGNNHEYVGHSAIVDFLGNYIIEPQETEGVFITDLNKDDLLQTRKKLAFLDDKDDFEIS